MGNGIGYGQSQSLAAFNLLLPKLLVIQRGTQPLFVGLVMAALGELSPNVGDGLKGQAAAAWG